MMRLFLLFLFCQATLLGSEVQCALDALPQKDYERLEHLFSHFVQGGNLGFVLFGQAKPACVCSIPIKCHYPIVPPKVSTSPLEYQKNVRLGWKTWKRYSHRFAHPNIIICEEKFKRKSTEFIHVYFIDKHKLYTLLAQYHEDFKEVLGEHFDRRQFIAMLEKKRQLTPLIHHDEKLLGLLLGFGVQAATDYRDGKFEGKELFSTLVVAKKPSSKIAPVSYRGDPNSDESKWLIAQYTDEMAEIEKIFESESFLTHVLERLCFSGEP